jgi:hypothetical protein
MGWVCGGCGALRLFLGWFGEPGIYFLGVWGTDFVRSVFSASAASQKEGKR